MRIPFDPTKRKCDLGLDEEVRELVHGHLAERLGIVDDLEDTGDKVSAVPQQHESRHLRLLLGRIEVGLDVALEFLEEERGALGTTALVADRVLDLDLVQDGAVVKLNKDSVADGTLGGLVVLDAEPLVLDASDFGAEGVNAGVLGRRVGVGLRGELAKD